MAGAANLKPFVKGASGNPAGRPKISADVKALARNAGPDAMRAIVKLLKSSDERTRLSAAVVILERGFGRVAQAVDPDAEKAAGVTIQIVQMPATQAPAKVIDHDGANHHPVAEQVAAPTVSVRPLELSAIRGQAGGSGLPS